MPRLFPPLLFLSCSDFGFDDALTEVAEVGRSGTSLGSIRGAVSVDGGVGGGTSGTGSVVD